MLGITGRSHDPVAERVAFGDGIVEEQISGVALPLSCRGVFWRLLDSVLKQALKGSLFRAQAVDRPAAEEASIVRGEGLLFGVRLVLCRATAACLPGET